MSALVLASASAARARLLDASGVRAVIDPAAIDEARIKAAQRAAGATAAVLRKEHVLWRHVERARVILRRFSDAFLDFYLDAMGDRVLQSVGGYELEGLGAQLVARIEGDYFAILGLPLLPLLEFLRAEGALRA